MPWYVSIIFGVLFVVFGVLSWMDTHKLERVVKHTSIHLVDIDGNIIQTDVGPTLFENYKIVKKIGKK